MTLTPMWDSERNIDALHLIFLDTQVCLITWETSEYYI